jgi:hypothetical protein
MMKMSIMMKAPRIMLEPPRIMLEPLCIMVKAPRRMVKAPRIMVKALRIMPKAPRIMPKEPRIMLKAPNKMSFDHLRQLWLSIRGDTIRCNTGVPGNSPPPQKKIAPPGQNILVNLALRGPYFL